MCVVQASGRAIPGTHSRNASGGMITHSATTVRLSLAPKEPRSGASRKLRRSGDPLTVRVAAATLPLCVDRLSDGAEGRRYVFEARKNSAISSH